MHIVLLALDGNLPSGLVGLADVFWLAGKASALQPDAPSWPCEVILASLDGRAVTDGRGRPLRVDAALKDIPHADAVLVPGLMPAGDGLPPRNAQTAEAATWLRQQHAHGAWVLGSCSGVFVLGEAGLLNGRRCTTTWWLNDELKHRFPRCDAAWGSALIEDGRVVTAGGPLSWIDLALHTIRVLVGPQAARTAADFAVIDTAPLAQSVYVPPGHVQARDPFLVAAEIAVRSHRAAVPLTPCALAAQLATSERTLHRRLKRLGQAAPKGFIARVQLETARTLLETSRTAVKAVAQNCGWRDEGSFRRAFVRHTGMTPTAYRAWIGKRAGIDR
ncbi:GlxA family transcriptional regulator [Solimonas marina]|uniref:Helix-turn-helix domain-containing protein n=1 Tax=Solimonas marina TaxID=2714601 RepID=A0A969WD56_9GAMM|nr:helix-turn-helix domain-containing protein [Solimonas marina]NKF24359.1 helix-turn-helix domain-containing protein [Solimonas marina]